MPIKPDADDVQTGEIFGQEAFKLNQKRQIASEFDYDVALRTSYTTHVAELNKEYLTEKQELRDQYMQDRSAARERMNLAFADSRAHDRYGLDRLWATSDAEQAAAATAIFRELMNQPTDRLAQLLTLIQGFGKKTD